MRHILSLFLMAVVGVAFIITGTQISSLNQYPHETINSIPTLTTMPSQETSSATTSLTTLTTTTDTQTTTKDSQETFPFNGADNYRDDAFVQKKQLLQSLKRRQSHTRSRPRQRLSYRAPWLLPSTTVPDRTRLAFSMRSKNTMQKRRSSCSAGIWLTVQRRTIRQIGRSFNAWSTRATKLGTILTIIPNL